MIVGGGSALLLLFLILPFAVLNTGWGTTLPLWLVFVFFSGLPLTIIQFLGILTLPYGKKLAFIVFAITWGFIAISLLFYKP